jgi:hypothetical protein
MECSSEGMWHIAAVCEAAFDGDTGALALLDELADEGDLDALVYADLAADNVDEVDGG